MEGLSSNLKIQDMKPQELPYDKVIDADMAMKEYDPEIDSLPKCQVIWALLFKTSSCGHT